MFDGRSHTSGAVPPCSELCAGVMLDRARRTLTVLDREDQLSAQKFELLCYFVDRAGVAVSGAELVRAGVLRPSQASRLKGLM